MSDWLVYLGIPVFATLLVIGSGIVVSFFAARYLLMVIAPSRAHLTLSYSRYLWMGSVLAAVGYLAMEFGYQLNFWEAPGIWGAPGKSATVWGQLQYVASPLGFALGIALNAVLEQRMPNRAQAVRVGVTVVSFLFFLLTFVLSAKHGWETLG